MAAIFFLLSSALARPLYEFQRGGERWTLNQEKKSISLASEGMTYLLPVDGCTKAEADYLLNSLRDNFNRLVKSEKDEEIQRLGSVRSHGEGRILRELALREFAPNYFARLPARFVNLMVTAHGKCPRSFK